MSLNRAWHAAHRMPPRATLDQRVAWHLAHAAACDCRPLSPAMRAEILRRGLTIPPPPASTPGKAGRRKSNH